MAAKARVQDEQSKTPTSFLCTAESASLAATLINTIGFETKVVKFCDVYSCIICSDIMQSDVLVWCYVRRSSISIQ